LELFQEVVSISEYAGGGALGGAELVLSGQEEESYPSVGVRLYLAIISRFFLNVKTTIQQKSVTPVVKPMRERTVTYSL